VFGKEQRVWPTKPLSAEAEADKRRWNGEVVDDRVDVDPEDELVVGSNQLSTIRAIDEHHQLSN